VVASVDSDAGLDGRSSAAEGTLVVRLDRPGADGASPAARVDGLTPRERQVLAAVAAGGTDVIIANDLGIAVSTVRSHLERIREKTGLRRRSELTRLAVEARVLPELLAD
jgi:DNA-binding CsgD family transcriptional regulator